MRGAISKSGVNSLAGRRKQKVWRRLNGHESESWIQQTDLEPLLAVLRRPRVSNGKVESEGHEEKWPAAIDRGKPQDEPVGQRWGKVESALLGRRRSHSPTAPRCLRTARYRRTTRDLRRTDRVPGWHWGKRTYKRKRNGERRSVSSPTAE